MSGTRIAIATIAVVLAVAELVRPTTYHEKRSARAIVAASDTNRPAPIDQLALDDLPPIVLPAMGNVDRVYVTVGANSRNLTSSRAVPTGATIGFVGWCADPVAREPGSALVAVVDDHRRIDVSAGYRIARPDVATYYKAPALTDSGFTVDLSAAAVGPGDHDVAFAVVTSDATALAALPIHVRFHVR